jgi:hypothetical protein
MPAEVLKARLCIQFEGLSCREELGIFALMPWLANHPAYEVTSLNPLILLLIVVPDE